METRALIEKGKDGTYGIFTPDLESTIIGSGDTIEEAKADFENSIIEMREVMDERYGTPNELTDVAFVYEYDMASFFDYFDWINVSKASAHIGISKTLVAAYKNGRAYISEKRGAEIEAKLQEMGKELSTARIAILV